MPVGRKILALLFELESDNGSICLLIAWLERHDNGKYLEATHPDKTLLDVRAGDRVTFKRKYLFSIRRIKPWRTTECKDETQYTEIECGQDWEQGLNSAS